MTKGRILWARALIDANGDRFDGRSQVNEIDDSNLAHKIFEEVALFDVVHVEVDESAEPKRALLLKWYMANLEPHFFQWPFRQAILLEIIYALEVGKLHEHVSKEMDLFFRDCSPINEKRGLNIYRQNQKIDDFGKHGEISVELIVLFVSLEEWGRERIGQIGVI